MFLHSKMFQFDLVHFAHNACFVRKTLMLHLLYIVYIYVLLMMSVYYTNKATLLLATGFQHGVESIEFQKWFSSP